MNYRKVYLWLSALGLFPIALSYGVAPVESLNWLFGMTVEVPNQAHVFRGIMGLYLGMVLLWIIGAMNESFERPAIIAEVFFMGGLAVGRLLSVLVDGVPHRLLLGYIVVELVLAIVGLALLLQTRPQTAVVSHSAD